jgi:hypothetical protein
MTLARTSARGTRGGYRVIPTLFPTFILLVAILISLSLSLSLSPILPLPSLRKKREKLVFKSWYSVISKTNKSMTITIIANQ